MLAGLSRTASICIGTTALVLAGSAVYGMTSHHHAQSDKTIVMRKPADVPISEDVISGLASMNISIVDQGAASQSETDMARKAADAGFGAFLDDQAGSYYDVTFSTPNGPHKDEAAVMVIMTHQAVPLIVPMGFKNVPSTVDSTFVAFVNRESSEVVKSVTFQPEALR
jgi:hypothetical protein